MQSRGSCDAIARRLLGGALLVVLSFFTLPGRALAQDECLVEVHTHTGSVPDTGGSLCAVASGKVCTFDLELCRNQPGCLPATFKRTIRASGLCNPGKLRVTKAQSPCGAFTGVRVKTKKNGKKMGTCRVRVVAKSSDKPKRKHIDMFELDCMPAGGTCGTTTTTTVRSTTTTTLRCPTGCPPGSNAQCPSGQACDAQCQCAQVTCNPIVAGQPIANTYNVQDVNGPNVCILGSAANQLLPCTSDADCGGGGGSCVPTPWISAGGVVLPFPLGISATYTVAAADSPPTCSHSVCISCGNPAATCPGMTGCATNTHCVSPAPTCCDTPAFTVPTFFLSGLNVCVKVDQKDCGVGVVNTSNPQTGDNEVTKVGDTSDPGADCTYGTPDDPAAKPCGTLAGGAGADKAGKVVKTLGNGTADAVGIHSRFSVPLLATAWVDRPAPG